MGDTDLNSFIEIRFDASTATVHRVPTATYFCQTLTIEFIDASTSPQKSVTLRFHGVQCFNCYCSDEIHPNKPSSVLTPGLWASSETSWLTLISSQLERFQSRYGAQGPATNLQHFILSFDEHGWYEVIAESHQISIV